MSPDTTNTQSRITPILSPILLISPLLILTLIAIRKIVFGSWSGGFTYLYTGTLSLNTLIVAVICLILSNTALNISLKLLNQRQNTAIAITLLTGFVIQIAISSLTPYSFSQIINSNTANSFYTPVFLYNPSDLLANFNSSLSQMEIHTSANMPGKIITFYLLNQISKSPQVIGYLITLISSLGSLLVFYISKHLFKNLRIALLAMFLYLIIPSKQFFLPLLNTITPVLALLSVFLLISFHKSRKLWIGFPFGITIFLLFMFEPTPLVLLSLLAPIILLQIRPFQNRLRQTSKFITLSLVSFTLCAVSLIYRYNYNPFFTLSMMFQRAFQFNQSNSRPCDIWLMDNLKDLFINSGPVQSLVFLVLVVSGLSNIETKNSSKRFIFTTSLAVFTAINLINFMMINCGETIRLWIFLGVFVNLFAAYQIGKLFSVKAWHWIISITIVQTVVSQSLINFISP